MLNLIITHIITYFLVKLSQHTFRIGTLSVLNTNSKTNYRKLDFSFVIFKSITI